jgi:glycerol-3-phosphate acyltransferase PlsY
LDCLKGYVAIVLCTLIYFLINRYAFLGTMDFAYIVYLAGFFAIVGHCYPIQYFCALAKYKTINEQVKEKSGGKGVAATGGLAFAFNP